MGGGKGGDPKVPVTDYYISAQYGGGHGPVDEVLEFSYGEKKLLTQSITTNQTVTINKPSLFGGPKSEGGFKGTIDIMLGGDTQLVSSALAASLGRNGAGTTNPNELPGYRGLFSFFIHGGTVSEKAGANIGSNTAFVKSIWAKVRRAPKGCPFDPVITVDGMKLSNPAAIIWECLTNGVWGMGGAVGNLDEPSFTAAATTLAAEGFGLGILWHQQESIEDFTGEILNHIDASLALDPFTGKFRLKLIRDDYDINTVPVFGPGNCNLTSFSRRGWGETINEINVSWTNPLNEQRETVTVHDTATISLQGGVPNSETRDFPGIRTAELALRVATRELLQVSSALANAEIEVNREAWKVLPGDVIALTWPEYDYALIPMRVVSADYGKPGDSMIQLKLLEDVFGMPQSSWVESPGTSWVNPAIEPVPLTREHITSVPYYLLVQSVGEANAEAVADTSDADVVFGTHEAQGIFDYDVMAQEVTATGGSNWVRKGSADPAGFGLLAADLAQEVSSVVASLDSISRPEQFVAGTFLWIGPIDQTGELALVTLVDGSGYNLTRGVLDTIPKEWPAGTGVWALNINTLGSAKIERTIGETATVRLLTNTSLGQLDISAASNVSAQMSGRLHRPYRPANVTLDGQLWPDPEYSPTFPAALAWAGRNRLEETSILNAWSNGHVTPEDGTTFEVRLYGEDDQGALTLYHTEDVGTATTYAVDPGTEAPPGGSAYIWAEVWALRDGLYSWQAMGHRMRLVVPPADLTGEYVPVFAPIDVTLEEI